MRGSVSVEGYLFVWPCAAAGVTGWQVTRLTTAAHGQVAPDVSGDRVVWQGWDGSRWQVFTREIGVDHAPIRPTTGVYFQVSPRVSGDRIAWLGRQRSSHWQVYSWKQGDSSPTTVTTDAHNHYGVQLSGDRVVWATDKYGDNSHFDVFTWKVGDSSPTTLATEVHGMYSDWPDVSGDRVVWRDSARVLTWNAGDSWPTTLTSDARGGVPHVSGDRVVWQAWDGSHLQIYTRKVGVDASSVRLTSGAHDHEYPIVSGDRVVWQAWDGSHWQIYTRKVGVDASSVRLTSGAHDHEYPQVSGNRVMWQVWDGSHWQFYTRKVGVDASSVKLTAGDHDQSAPTVSGDRVVWQGRYRGYWQIYRAKLITKPRIARSPNVSTLTVYRHDGLARYTLSAIVRDRDGTLVAGKRVYLQTSPDGRTWRNTYKTLRTNRSGQVSRSFTKTKRMTLYYRWYAPSSPSYHRAYAAGQRVRVR